MDNDKTLNINLETQGRGEKPDFSSDASSSRARNRTVMLTPEITGQVRARLAQEVPDPGHASGGVAPLPQGGGFEHPRGGGFAAPIQSRASGAFEAAHDGGVRGAGALPGQARVKEGIVWAKPSRVIGFLVSFDSNEYGDVYELRVGRVMVTSGAQGDANTLLLNDPSVSPMHAIMRVSERGEVQVLDQLSENGTHVKRAAGHDEHLSGDKGDLHHGDVVSFGNRSFVVCIVPRAEE